ncbi:MAG TPA: serine hydrolase domain-containing protein [Candidatus Baltobacteraceae bacterium]|nr:serine hydrolase domain-containing protein [Candidatus Baltobacteraceae bacterium]
MITALLLAATLSSTQIHALDSAGATALKERHIPSVVIEVDRDGKRVFEKAYGYRNVADKLSANTQTLYQYGSLTKQFTAMGILLLAQDGKLDVKADIGTWFPKFANRGITIENLLIHTSGIPDLINDSGTEFTLKYAALPFSNADDIIAWAADKPLVFPVGTRTKYSNTGYLLLGKIIERVSGKSLDAFFAVRIFQPLGMHAAHGYQMLKILPNLALGYTIWNADYATFDPHGTQGATVGALVNAPPWNMRNADSAGYLVGDAADLQTWDDALLAGKLLSGKWRERYLSRGTLANGEPAFAGPENPGKYRPAYCYGGFAYAMTDGHRTFGANGGTSGFASFTATIPDQRLAITTLTNLGGTNNALLTTPVLDALLLPKP